MPWNNFITEILNVQMEDIREIHPVSDSSSNMTIRIKLKNRQSHCPFCGGRVRINCYKERKLTHSIFMDRKCVILYLQRRYQCVECKFTFNARNPFINTRENITCETKVNILKALKHYSVTYSYVASAFNVSKPTVIRIFDKHVNIPRKKLTEAISIDEHYFPRSDYNSLYCCLIMDFVTGTMLDILPDRRKSHLQNYFSTIKIETMDSLSRSSELDNVKYISTDMYEVYRDIASIYFPKAKVCADSFHVTKHLTDCLRDVRLRCRRNTQDKKLIYLLSKFSFIFDHQIYIDNYPKYNRRLGYKINLREIRELIFKHFPDLEVAFNLKEMYMHFNKNCNVETAPEYLDTIIERFSHCGIPEYEPFYRLLTNWRTEIINSFSMVNGKRINNSYIESMNAKIEKLIYNSNGIVNYERARKRILYCLNENDTFTL